MTLATESNQIVPTHSARIVSDDNRGPAALLMELQSYRRHCIRAQGRLDRSIEALIARALGYHHDLEEAKRLSIYKLAQNIRKKVENDFKNHNVDYSGAQIPPAVINMIHTSYVSRVHWDNTRETVEEDMVKMARELPVWPWVKIIPGFAELGLAVIIGETGDLSHYSGPGKLWMRLGLGTVDGNRQNYIPKEVTGTDRAEEWKDRGYNPQRRSEVWNFVDDVMLRAQWRGDRDEDGKDPRITKKPIAVPAHPIGTYGRIYGDRKEWNQARGLTPRHADKEARRFMAKKFIRDLWVAWRELVDTKAAAA